MSYLIFKVLPVVDSKCLRKVLLDESNSVDMEEVMALEFWKDGKKVEVKAICDKGYVGQAVILDHVSFGNSPNLDEYPLASYPQPYLFNIVQKALGKNGFYVLADSKGVHITVRDKFYGASCEYLYDAREWIAWQDLHKKEKLERKERKIQSLEIQVATLKDVLIKTGVRLITKEAAQKLDIPTHDPNRKETDQPYRI